MARNISFMFCLACFAANSLANGSKSIEKPKHPDTKQECVEKGGKWILYPMGQFYFCAVKTTDKGKACSDDSECQGDCIPAERKDKSPGICSPTLPMPGGCPKHMINGKIISEPCI